MLLTALMRGFESRAITYDPLYPGDPALADLFGGGQVSKTGMVVNEKTALGASAVWRAVNIRSMVMGDVPRILYRHNPDRGRERLTKHPLWNLLHEIVNPELSMTSYTFQSMTENHVLTWGNAYAWIQRRGRLTPVALWPHPPNMVEVDATRAGTVVYIFYGQREPDKTRRAEDVLHFKGPAPDGIKGWSRIRIARESIGQVLAAQGFGAAYFGQGARMGAVITVQPGFRPEDAKLMQESIAKQTVGEQNWHRPLILPGADKVQPITYSAEDAQFLGTMEFGVTEAARWFDVPLVLMMLPNSEPRANAEQDSLNFVKFTIGPECRNFEQELNQKLLLPSERSDIFIEHNLDALLRGDFKTRMEGWHFAVGDGLRTRDEVARVENWNPIGPENGGDVRTVPVNMMNLKTLVGQTAAPPVKITPKPDGTTEMDFDDEKMKTGEGMEGDTPPTRNLLTFERMVAFLTPLLDDAHARLLAKEQKAIDMIITKSDFVERRVAFYDDHLAFVISAYRPIVEVAARMLGMDRAPEGMAEIAAARYIKSAKASPWPEWRTSGVRPTARGLVAAMEAEITPGD